MSKLLLSGDMQSDTDNLLLSGDMQTGSDVELLSIIDASVHLLSQSATLSGEVSPLIGITGVLVSSAGHIDGYAEIIDMTIYTSAALKAGSVQFDILAKTLISVSGHLEAAPPIFSNLVRTSDNVLVVARVKSAPATLSGTLKSYITTNTHLEASDSQLDAIVGSIIAASGDLVSESALLDGTVTLGFTAAGQLSSGPAVLNVDVITAYARRVIQVIFY